MTQIPYLLTPGPLTTTAATKEAMLRDFGSRDRELIEITRRVRARLLDIVGARGTHECVLVQGSGTYAVEAALGTLVRRDAKVAVLVNGAYGRRIVEILARLGRAHVVLETPEHVPNDPEALDALLARDPAITDVAMIFTETTTGMRNPLEAIAQVVARHRRELFVDAMSSFGSVPFDVRTLPIATICASSNKSLEGVPGIGFVLARRDLLEASAGNAHSLVLDLHAQWRGFETNGQWRFTPPVQVLAAWDRALDQLDAEGGVEARAARYGANHEVLLEGMRAMGFRTLLPDHLMSATIVTFLRPTDPRFDFERFYARLRELGFVIYPGKLTHADTFRIGCVGDITPEIMRRALAAIAQTVREQGFEVGAPAEPRPAEVTVNGRRYAWPSAPVAVICLDGCAPAYLDRAIAAGVMPHFARMAERGTRRLARSVVPSFTNPNNLSIVTGAPPCVHGVPGNYFIDPASGAEVMMNDPKYLRAPTLLAAFAKAGAKVVAVTAKDKLRAMLGAGLAGRGICFSIEKAAEATREEHGRGDVLAMLGRTDAPPVYSAEITELVLEAGVKLLEQERPDLLYLSSTDYIQHKHAPDEPEALALYARLDRHLGELDRLGAIVVLTADHGMNAKTDPRGAPNALYLGDLLDTWLGQGEARVVLPITDPYVVHHGALGSFAWVHLRSADAREVASRLAELEPIELVLDRTAAARRFELPADRIGDLAVVSRADTVLGTHAARHDLSLLDRPLRSHGGISEEIVPLIVNRPCRLPERVELRNFDAFHLALNLVQAASAPVEGALAPKGGA